MYDSVHVESFCGDLWRSGGVFAGEVKARPAAGRFPFHGCNRGAVSLGAQPSVAELAKRFFFNRSFARVSPVFVVALLAACVFGLAPNVAASSSSADPTAAVRRQSASAQFLRKRKSSAVPSITKRQEKAHPRRLQAGRQHLSTSLPDYAARRGGSRRAAGGCRIVYRDGRAIWAQLLPVCSGYLSIFASRISHQPVLPGERICVRESCRRISWTIWQARAKFTTTFLRKFPRSPHKREGESAGSARGVGVAAKFRTGGGSSEERDCEKCGFGRGAAARLRRSGAGFGGEIP